MIENPDNGRRPETQAKDADPAEHVETATAVAEPDAQTTQSGEMRSEQDAASPSPSDPEVSAQTATPMTESVPSPTTEGDQSVAIGEPLTATTEPTSEAEFSSELSTFRQSFEEIQAEFISEPRAAVEKAETLIGGLMNALHEELQRIHGNINSETDTEQLRVAMLSYRELFDSLGGHQAA